MVKVALVTERPPTEMNSWYIKAEDVYDRKTAMLMCVELNEALTKLSNLPKTVDYCSFTYLSTAEVGIRIPLPVCALDTLSTIFGMCGYVLRTVFPSPYGIRGDTDDSKKGSKVDQHRTLAQRV